MDSSFNIINLKITILIINGIKAIQGLKLTNMTIAPVENEC